MDRALGKSTADESDGRSPKAEVVRALGKLTAAVIDGRSPIAGCGCARSSVSVYKGPLPTTEDRHLPPLTTMAISFSQVLSLYFSGDLITQHSARSAFDADCRLPVEAGAMINPLEWEFYAEVSSVFGFGLARADRLRQEVYKTARDRTRAAAGCGAISAEECRAACGLLKSTYRRAGVRVSLLLPLLSPSPLTPSSRLTGFAPRRVTRRSAIGFRTLPRVSADGRTLADYANELTLSTASSSQERAASAGHRSSAHVQGEPDRSLFLCLPTDF